MFTLQDFGASAEALVIQVSLSALRMDVINARPWMVLDIRNVDNLYPHHLYELTCIYDYIYMHIHIFIILYTYVNIWLYMNIQQLKKHL